MCIIGQTREAVVIGELNLQLDEQTAYPWAFGSRFQYCEDRKAIAYYNRLTNSIKYFDYKTGKGNGETKFSKEGPNALGPDPYYFHYHNRDSIFVLSRGTNFSMFLINSSGEKINTYHYSSEDYSEIPFPRAATLFGAIEFRFPYVYIALEVSDKEERNIVAPVIRLNIKTDQFVYLKQPLPYENINVNTMAQREDNYYLYSSRVTGNIERDEIMISYPLEGHVYRLRDTTVIGTLDAKSDKIGDFLFLRKPRPNRYVPNYEESRSVAFSSAWYYGVIYNPYQGLYYRIGKVQRRKDTYSRIQAGEKALDMNQYSVTVFDSDFNKLADSIITAEDVLFGRGVFVTPDGLCGPQLNLKGEDVMGISIIGLK